MQSAGQGMIIFLIICIVLIVAAVCVFAFQVVKLTAQIKKTVKSSDEAITNTKNAVKYLQMAKAPALVALGYARKFAAEKMKDYKNNPKKVKKNGEKSGK